MGEEWVTFCSPARFGLSCWWSNWRILLLRQSCREEQLWPELFCRVALRAGAAYLWHLAGSEVTCVVLWDGIHGFSALSMAQPSPSILSSLVELSWAWPCVEKMARGFSRRVQYCLVWQIEPELELRSGQGKLNSRHCSWQHPGLPGGLRLTVAGMAGMWPVRMSSAERALPTWETAIVLGEWNKPVQSSGLGETMGKLKESKEQQDRCFLAGHWFETGGENSGGCYLEKKRVCLQLWTANVKIHHWAPERGDVTASAQPLFFPVSKEGLKTASDSELSVGFRLLFSAG